MGFDEDIRTVLLRDGERLRLLRLVRSLGLTDCFVAAGFVRNAVWDALHGRPPSSPEGHVDVIWFDRIRTAREVDDALEAKLAVLDPSVAWSVKNQARMHLRNGDDAYRDSCDAMRFWPETATAVGVRVTHSNELELAAPFGVADLVAGIVRPTPRFRGDKHAVFEERVRAKRWLERWPLLRVEPYDHSPA